MPNVAIFPKVFALATLGIFQAASWKIHSYFLGDAVKIMAFFLQNYDAVFLYGANALYASP